MKPKIETLLKQLAITFLGLSIVALIVYLMVDALIGPW